MEWSFDNSYARDLEGFYVAWQPAPSPSPALVALNDDLAGELRLDPAELRTPEGIAVLSGNAVPAGAQPLAQAYSGHQFGQLTPMLGDGRAVLLGEVIDVRGDRRDIAFKGSGRTPFSRGGDGKAVLGPVLREYVVGEAMHALGIPTTRALAAVTTGQRVHRDGRMLPGAVLTRVASSHLRVGTFEMARHHGEVGHVRQLADYAMKRHYGWLADGDYAGFLSAVVSRQAGLVAAWMSVGFVHGVMNSDNMTISGETIDYGPCAFLDVYDDQQVFSSIDVGGRYRYSQQPPIAAWNLSRLAEALAPLVEPQADDLARRVASFDGEYRAAYLSRFRTKLGLAGEQEGDRRLINDLMDLLRSNRLDFTGSFRRLARVLRGERDALREHVLEPAAYDEWQSRWVDRIGSRDPEVVAKEMDLVNPIYIPRNHLVEEALRAAVADDLGPFAELVAAVSEPFTPRAGFDRYAEPGPDGFSNGYVTFCGT